MNFKSIHIGSLIEQRVKELKIESPRLCKFLDCLVDDINKDFESADLPVLRLLKWSKILEYDFFRIYSQHLILFAPENPKIESSKMTIKSSLPNFRKNIYTKELIDFILQLINTGKKTRYQIIVEYNIPKTTLYKWISKYNTIKSF